MSNAICRLWVGVRYALSTIFQDSLLVFSRNVTSILHCFRHIMRCSYKPEMTSSMYLYKRTLFTFANHGFWRSYPDFILVYNCKFTSIMHRFRDNDVVLRTRTDVMMFFPLRELYTVLNYGFCRSDPNCRLNNYYTVLPLFSLVSIDPRIWVRPLNFCFTRIRS